MHLSVLNIFMKCNKKKPQLKHTPLYTNCRIDELSRRFSENISDEFEFMAS